MATDFIQRLSDSDSLTDILIQMESFIDDLDTYAFKNWFEGELVDGPNVERHWVSMTLTYDYNCMPDPEGAIRLLKYGAYVAFKKAKVEDTKSKQFSTNEISSRFVYQSGIHPILTQAKPVLKAVWLVTIKIPRHFISELQQMDDLLDDDVDIEHVQAAKDADLQAQDAYSEPDADAEAEPEGDSEIPPDDATQDQI